MLLVRLCPCKIFLLSLLTETSLLQWKWNSLSISSSCNETIWKNPPEIPKLLCVVLSLLSSLTGSTSEGFRELASFAVSCLWFIFNQNLDRRHWVRAQTTNTQLKIIVQKAVLNQSLGTGGCIFASLWTIYLLLVVFGLNALYLTCSAGMQIQFSLVWAILSPWNVLG